MPAPTLNATLVRRQEPGEGLLIYGVRSDEGPLQFLPGQFVNLGTPDESGRIDTRAYSIASAPGAGETEFVFTVVPQGTVSPRLARVRVGDRLAMETIPAGNFTLKNVPPDVDLLFVATGTGIAPFMSMLRSGQCKARKVTVVHGARCEYALCYPGELGRMEGVTYLPVTSRDDAWQGRKGRVQGVLRELNPSTEKTHALLCGNPEMIADVRELLEGYGFKKHRKRDPGNLHFEAYW